MVSVKILIDNNVLADLFVGDAERAARAAEWRRRFPVWIAPDLWRYEFGNVLRSQVRFREMAPEGAEILFERAFAMVRPSRAEVSETGILAEALASDLTFYDATYVAHARRLGLKVLTRDKAILGLGSSIAVSLDG